MTQTAIRPIQGQEMLEAMYWLPSYAFEPSPPLPDKAECQEILASRTGVTYYALFEGDRPVSTAASTPMTQQVRGAMVGASAIWGVATHPAARHKGYSRQVLRSLLAAAREDGAVLSCLYPFRESFYEALGYVTFPRPRRAQVNPAALMPLAKRELGGDVELMLIGEGIDAYIEYVRKLQPTIHGMGVFDDNEALRTSAGRNRFWLALAKVQGQVEGLMLYDLKGDAVTDFTLRALRFYYHTSQGKYLLLQWIARHAGQASQAELWLTPYEQPETWLPDMEITLTAAPRSPMGRVLDVARVGGMACGPGCFAAQVRDSLCPWNEGTWRFETADGILHIHQTENAQCELSIQAVAALLYGTHDPGDFAIRGWGSPSARVQETMRAMFLPMAPYLHEWF